MVALVPIRRLAESLSDLFPATDAGPIEQLLVEYADTRATVERIALIFSSEHTRGAVDYFVDGNVDRWVPTKDLFKLGPALGVLNATFWDRLLGATDVLDVMPAKRRDEWRKQIAARDVPEFTKEAIGTTLIEHLSARPRYFAERVDGLFQALSPEHKTNLPSGFRSKLILNHVVDWMGLTSSRVDYLIDLRIVVGKFMGRDDIGEGGQHVYNLTRELVKYARGERRGEWVTVDGGAIEIKLHKCGTCHVRLHEELAWRLNAVLASVHPGAIPESSRTRPARGKGPKKAARIELVERPLPFAVVRVLSEFKPADGRDRHAIHAGGGVWRYGYTWKDQDKHVRAEVERVLASIGGVEHSDNGWGEHRFDYDVAPVLSEIVASGCVPDQKAHQFYPTPLVIAERLVELADLGPDDLVLEPSAGQGAIALLLPKDRTTCVEASAMHCAVLRAKGFSVVHGDFLQFNRRRGKRPINKIVMNPPFDRGQWKAHVAHAAALLGGDDTSAGAVLVAVLPASAPNSGLDLPGFAVTWSEPIVGAFAGTNMSVVIMVAVKQCT
jgi:hypothetical protein